ncbi:SMC-Scp complex subunit ScpB [Thalassotalea montiporae]
MTTEIDTPASNNTTNNNTTKLSAMLEALIFAAEKPLTPKQLRSYIQEQTGRGFTLKAIKDELAELVNTYQHRGIQLAMVAGGYRFQTNTAVKPLIQSIQKEKTSKISPAMMETLAVIAYKQPITRAEIEEIRGVAVSSYIIKTLTERAWVKTDGYKEVPGRPALYVTTPEFLAYFGLNSLTQLPELMPISQADHASHAVEASLLEQES